MNYLLLLNVVADLMPASHRQSGRDGGAVTKRLTRANGSRRKRYDTETQRNEGRGQG